MSISWCSTSTNAVRTYLRGYLPLTSTTFAETVAKLATISGQTPADLADGDKTSVEFVGTFKGEPFTLYDYKGGAMIHIGGSGRLDVDGLIAELLTALAAAEPTPYTATVPSEYGGWTHGFAG